MNNKVLIISGTPIVSGAEYVLGDYLYNNKNVHNIQILHSDVDKVEEYYSKINFNKRNKSKYLNPVGVIGNSKLNLIKKLINLFLSFFIFFKIFRDKSIKKVLGNNTGDTIYSIYSYIFGRKHINYIHDMIEPNSMMAKSILFFDKFIYKYIAVSNAVKDALIKIGIEEDKIEVIYNGLEYNKAINYKEIKDSITFGFVGNIEDRKNPLEFLKFIEIMQDNLKDKLVLGKIVYGNVAEKELYKAINKYIQEKKLNVELIGVVKKDKMNQFYDSIDFLVLTSRKDPLPTVILEAFNNSVPVIGHNIDGVPEMIDDGYNGFLYSNIGNFLGLVKRILQCSYYELQENANLTIKKRFNNITKVQKLNHEFFFEKE